MKNIVYAKNPDLAMIPKNESPDGFAGKYIPVPLEYANPAGRSHTFANAQNQQTASSVISYFVYAIQDYQLVTITNLLNFVGRAKPSLIDLKTQKWATRRKRKQRERLSERDSEKSMR